MGFGLSDLQYLVPGYGQYKAGTDLMNSDMMTGNNVPTQYQDHAQIAGLINAGFGAGGQAGGGAGSPWGALAGGGGVMGAMQRMRAPGPGEAGGQNITNYAAPTLNMGDDPFRAAQLQQMQQLQGIASGQQQGAGELAAQRQYANALSAQQAQARMARGGNAALAYRNAANQSAALGSTAAGMGQQAALQDQQGAQGMLGQIGAQGRGADINVANANAGYQMGANQMNSGNYLQLLGQLQGMNQGELGARAGAAEAANQRQAGLLGGLLSAGGQMAGASMKSDERLKTDIVDGRAEIDALLDSMQPKSYAYIDQKHGEGRLVGIMAQDMERSEAGRRIVRDAPDGKEIDINKALSAALAGAARLNERVRELERGTKR